MSFSASSDHVALLSIEGSDGGASVGYFQYRRSCHESNDSNSRLTDCRVRCAARTRCPFVFAASYQLVDRIALRRGGLGELLARKLSNGSIDHDLGFRYLFGNDRDRAVERSALVRTASEIASPDPKLNWLNVSGRRPCRVALSSGVDLICNPKFSCRVHEYTRFIAGRSHHLPSRQDKELSLALKKIRNGFPILKQRALDRTSFGPICPADDPGCLCIYLPHLLYLNAWCRATSVREHQTNQAPDPHCLLIFVAGA